MDFRAILEALAGARVEFVVVGGVCAVLHGVPTTTFDLDIVHERSAENVRRLHGVLQDLDACYREHLPRRLRPLERDLALGGHHLLMTRAGPLDLLGTVVGGRSYAELVEHSREKDLGQGLGVRVLDLELLVRLKEESSREKDRAQLPLLRRTLAERRPPGS
jgi:hypothetical protein